MQTYRYILQPYKGPATRHECPHCKKKKTFARYVDTLMDNEQLSDNAGRCNRESGCDYHYSPRRYFEDNGIAYDESTYSVPESATVQEHHYIDRGVFEKSLTAYDKNNLVIFLRSIFDETTVQSLIESYQ